VSLDGLQLVEAPVQLLQGLQGQSHVQAAAARAALFYTGKKSGEVNSHRARRMFRLLLLELLSSTHEKNQEKSIPACEPQSRQSARLFLQSSELGPPSPLTHRRVCLPLWCWGYTLACGRGGGEGVPILTRRPTLWYCWYGMYVHSTLCCASVSYFFQ
jgi:hypothetical protein